MGRRFSSEEIKGLSREGVIQGRSQLQNELAGNEDLEQTDP